MKEVYHLALQLGVLLRLARLRCIQLFRNRLSNKTVRDNAERYYTEWGSWSLIQALWVSTR